MSTDWLIGITRLKLIIPSDNTSDMFSSSKASVKHAVDSVTMPKVASKIQLINIQCDTALGKLNLSKISTATPVRNKIAS